jgi:hypothetical protein
MAGIWEELGIDATDDVASIRKAYAKRLKQVQPEDDPEGFQRLRAAYETALSAARVGQMDLESPLPLDVDANKTTGSLPPRPGIAAHVSVGTGHSTRISRAAALAEELRQVLAEQGEDAAVARLAEQCASAELQDIELKLALEAVLEDEDLVHVARRFQAERAYQDLIQLRKLLRATASQPSAPREAKVRYLALVMLTGPYRIGLFYQSLWRFPELARLVAAHLQRLEQDAPAVLQVHLNKRTVRWWSARRPRGPSPIAELASRPWLLLLITLLVIAGLSKIYTVPLFLRAFFGTILALGTVYLLTERRWPALLARLKAFPKESLALAAVLVLAISFAITFL